MLTRRTLLLILLAIAGIAACHQQVQVTPPVKDPNYKKAKSFLYKQNDSAFYYFNNVATAAMDSLQTAFAYNYMGRIQAEAGDYFGGQESLSMSLRYLDTANEKHRQCLAANYNELGLTSISLKDYAAAIKYFDQVKPFEDKEDQWVLLNNKALAYQEIKDYGTALKIYQSILGQTKKPRTYARVLTNLATTKWLVNSNYSPVNEFRKALLIRRQEQDQWGLNSSYLHLTDYYITVNIDSAMVYANKMYTIARELVSPDDELEALAKLIRLGAPLKARSYFKRHKQLNDSLQTARNAAKNQFAMIRYEVEKSKADNLKYQKDIAEQQFQLSKERFIRYGSITLFVLIIGTTSYWYKKRKKQAVQESQLLLSTKVHNRVANGLYQLMQEVDNQPQLDKELVARRLNVLYERSRDISHEPIQPDQTDFTEEINRLLMAFAEPKINLAIVGNHADYWKNVDPKIVSELEQVLQEWMVNMKKHSQATNVGIRFERTGNRLDIYYSDNGVGLPAKIQPGRGLYDTENRIKSLGGQIIFDGKAVKGVKIHLSLPSV